MHVNCTCSSRMHAWVLQTTEHAAETETRHDSATVFLSKRKQETQAGAGGAQRPAETQAEGTRRHSTRCRSTACLLPMAEQAGFPLPPRSACSSPPMPPLSLPARRRARGRTADGRNERSTFPTARHTGSRTLSSDAGALTHAESRLAHHPHARQSPLAERLSLRCHTRWVTRGMRPLRTYRLHAVRATSAYGFIQRTAPPAPA